MISASDVQRIKMQLMIFWIIWGSLLAGLVVIYVILGQGPVKPVVAADLPVNLAVVVPLFVSIVLRWLVLPRCHELMRAFPVYIMGLALAEAWYFPRRAVSRQSVRARRAGCHVVCAFVCQAAAATPGLGLHSEQLT